jgi:hypothetical protein
VEVNVVVTAVPLAYTTTLETVGVLTSFPLFLTCRVTVWVPDAAPPTGVAMMYRDVQDTPPVSVVYTPSGAPKAFSPFSAFSELRSRSTAYKV